MGSEAVGLFPEFRPFDKSSFLQEKNIVTKSKQKEIIFSLIIIIFINQLLKKFHNISQSHNDIIEISISQLFIYQTHHQADFDSFQW